MSQHSDHADTVAGQVCCQVIYPRFADFVRAAITYCTLDAEPLSDEQCEQLYRAAFEAGDGVLAAIADVIDTQAARGLLGGLTDA